MKSSNQESSGSSSELDTSYVKATNYFLQRQKEERAASSEFHLTSLQKAVPQVENCVHPDKPTGSHSPSEASSVIAPLCSVDSKSAFGFNTLFFGHGLKTPPGSCKKLDCIEDESSEDEGNEDEDSDEESNPGEQVLYPDPMSENIRKLTMTMNQIFLDSVKGHVFCIYDNAQVAALSDSSSSTHHSDSSIGFYDVESSFCNSDEPGEPEDEAPPVYQIVPSYATDDDLSGWFCCNATTTWANWLFGRCFKRQE